MVNQIRRSRSILSWSGLSLQYKFIILYIAFALVIIIALTGFFLHRQTNQLKVQYYCPLKSNRHVDDSDGIRSHQRIDPLQWSDSELAYGKSIHIQNFPKAHRVKRFRLVLSTKRTEYVVTNDLFQNSTDETKIKCSIRWKIEPFHREAKQVTGLESCQCRKQRAQRNHIGCPQTRHLPFRICC